MLAGRQLVMVRSVAMHTTNVNDLILEPLRAG
jgi:hypothetical protein